MTPDLRPRTALVTAALVAAGIAHSAPTKAAEPAAPFDSVGVAMFERAMPLLAQKRYAEACPDLEEAVRRIPSGLGAKIALAECREGEGKLATAWSRWRDAQETAHVKKDVKNEALARSRAAALEPRLSRLTITAPAEVAGQPGLVVQHDAAEVTRRELGLTFNVDGGAHVITANAKGKREWRKDVSIAQEGAKVVVAIPMLEDALVEPPPPPPPVAVRAPPPPPVQSPVDPAPGNVNAGAMNVAPPPSAPPAASRGVPGWAWGAGAAGLALVGGAIAFRVDQSSVAGTIDAKCPLAGRQGCIAGYDFTSDRAREVRDFDLFLGLGIGGIVAVGASVIGIVTATPSKPAPPAAAWTVLPAALPGHASGVAYTKLW
jgi:hypothetical protein